MLGRLPEPRFAPCDDCGASLARADRDAHVCDHERWVDYQLFHLREELALLDDELDAYLASPKGRFELYYAARARRDERTRLESS